MFTIGEHTVRCPRCNSDEYLTESRMTFSSGLKATIKTCHECGETYIVNKKASRVRRNISDIIGAFMGYTLIGLMLALSLAGIKIIYIIFRWICIGLWG